MLKYSNVQVTFGEVPSEVTLCINITGCPVHCPDCHSKYLWEDIGDWLDGRSLSQLIEANKGITCVAFMGGDNDPEKIYNLAEFIKRHYDLKVCWYSGRPLRVDFPKQVFDYVKTGPYKKELGGLDSPTTNQRFYAIRTKEIKNIKGEVISSYRYLEDYTHKFWKNYEIRNSQDDEE